MRALARFSLTILAATGAAFCQSADDFKFEVASVKPVTMEGKAVQMIGFEGGPGSSDPGQIRSHYTTLKAIIMYACRVKSFQVVGPAWLDTERFEIVAKVPAGATRGQALIMMQNLLGDRFGFKAHPETRDLPVYAISTTGHENKLKPAAVAEPETPAPDGPRPPLKTGEDGFPILAARTLSGGPIILYRNGRAKLMARNQTIQQLADMLNNEMDRMVLDETKLTGRFDFDLYWTPDPTLNGRNLGVAAPRDDGTVTEN